MNMIVNYGQMLGLNFMLILITSGFSTTAYVIYIVWIMCAAILSQVMYEGCIEILKGKYECPPEWALIPHDFTDNNKVILTSTTLIHAVLALTQLNSILLPVLMLVLLSLRFRSSNKMKEVLVCQA